MVLWELYDGLPLLCQTAPCVCQAFPCTQSKNKKGSAAFTTKANLISEGLYILKMSCDIFIYHLCTKMRRVLTRSVISIIFGRNLDIVYLLSLCYFQTGISRFHCLFSIHICTLDFVCLIKLEPQ